MNYEIPFYGGELPTMFEIERRCMDRDGKVIAWLDQHLPTGSVLDIGAGNGFTAQNLRSAQRKLVLLEPNPGMIAQQQQRLTWVRGYAQVLPFVSHTFDAAYATWAFFFNGIETLEQGLAELQRVVKPGAPMVIIDNAGDDEFCALAPHSIASDLDWWTEHGWQAEIIETSFRFNSLEEAHTLLRFYFGPETTVDTLELSYRVVAYTKTM